MGRRRCRPATIAQQRSRVDGWRVWSPKWPRRNVESPVREGRIQGSQILGGEDGWKRMPPCGHRLSHLIRTPRGSQRLCFSPAYREESSLQGSLIKDFQTVTASWLPISWAVKSCALLHMGKMVPMTCGFLAVSPSLMALSIFSARWPTPCSTRSQAVLPAKVLRFGIYGGKGIIS